jgi:two-component system, NarL family, sensor histidine kinase BarA
MPSDAIEAEMHFLIAMLLTIALLTVFLAMIALYVVVRYVIVKPLQHLRDISEEVRRGNTNLRADLQTNDEFQELGDSFNRMLRHLVDAQLELRDSINSPKPICICSK